MNTLGTSANVTAMSNVSGSIANVNTVASNISSVNNFAAQYRIASSDPSSSLTEGDLVFNTTSDKVRVYNGSAWQDVAPVATSVNASQISDVTATAAELNYNDIATLGTSAASKTVTADANGNIKISEEIQAKAYLETVVALSAAATVTPDLSTANVFTLTTDQNTTFVFNYGNIQLTTADAYAFTLRVLAGGGHSLTWPGSVKWAGGTAPDAPASGEYNTYVFVTVDGGSRYEGAQAVDAGA
jgi:hypothetical protein